MAILVEGSTAKVVDASGNRLGNKLRSFPVVDASYEVGYVGFDGTVTLLSGPWTDNAKPNKGRWWVVVVENDPHDTHEKAYTQRRWEERLYGGDHSRNRGSEPEKHLSDTAIGRPRYRG